MRTGINYPGFRVSETFNVNYRPNRLVADEWMDGIPTDNIDSQPSIRRAIQPTMAKVICRLVQFLLEGSSLDNGNL